MRKYLFSNAHHRKLLDPFMACGCGGKLFISTSGLICDKGCKTQTLAKFPKNFTWITLPFLRAIYSERIIEGRASRSEVLALRRRAQAWEKSEMKRLAEGLPNISGGKKKKVKKK